MLALSFSCKKQNWFPDGKLEFIGLDKNSEKYCDTVLLWFGLLEGEGVFMLFGEGSFFDFFLGNTL